MNEFHLTKPDWDYKEQLYLEPCSSCDCGRYILYMRGHLTYFKNGRDAENFNKFIPTATISVSDLYDLFANVCEKLDIESARDDLEQIIKKGAR